MLISINLTYSTAEASGSVSQTTTAFGDVLGQLGGSTPAFSQIERLAFCLTIAHPIVAVGSLPGSGSYVASTRSFYAKATLNYAAWVKPNWVARVEAVALAMTLGAKAIYRTRITEAERSKLLALISEAERQTVSNPPKTLVDLQPVELMFVPGRADPMISFGLASYKPAGSERSIILQPEKIDEYLSSRAGAPSELRPEMFKRYRRSRGVIEYREAWPADGKGFLDEWMGWMGLGHCDGGSIGSGTVEAVCYVVDARVARAALARELAASRFSAFSVRTPS